MPLRKLLSSSNLSAADIALLESTFNQCAPRFVSDEEREKLARDLVGLFTTGIRDESELIRRLVDRQPVVEVDNHSDPAGKV